MDTLNGWFLCARRRVAESSHFALTSKETLGTPMAGGKRRARIIIVPEVNLSKLKAQCLLLTSVGWKPESPMAQVQGRMEVS